MTDPDNTPDYVVAIQRKQAAELEALRHDIEAYRGALGYSVPDDHDGKLSNGSTPECGLCNSQARKDKLEALTKERSETASAIVKNIKELADLRTRNRELREALRDLSRVAPRGSDTNNLADDMEFNSAMECALKALAATEVKP